MKTIYCFTLVYFLQLPVFSQLPVKEFRSEVQNLKDSNEIAALWQKLKYIDQKVLLSTSNPMEYDSIAICNMERTALLFETYGVWCYDPTNTLPILNLAHCEIGEAQLAFWPIILKCANSGGVIEHFGGNYPAYELEALSTTIYGYSLLNQDSSYAQLMDNIVIDSTTAVTTQLIRSYEKQKALSQLTEMALIGRWYLQPFENRKSDGFFEFIRMSDKSIYIRKNHRLQKLIPLKSKQKRKMYRIEHEPFNWHYELIDGKLSLVDHKGRKLIEYTSYK